jgi:FAD:protein FMN transferase
MRHFIPSLRLLLLLPCSALLFFGTAVFSGTAGSHFSLLTGALFGLIVAPVLAQEKLSAPPANDSRIPIVGYESSFLALGTEVQLKAFHHDPDVVAAAFELAEQRVRELESILTDYDPTSETRQLSERAALLPTPVSDPLWEMLAACDRWHALSHGAFDASLGQLTQLWRKYRRSSRHPTLEQIATARAQTGWQHVQLNHGAHSVCLDSPGLRFDFGAIGKGYIVDQAFAVLTTHEVPCSLINISGNMRAGSPPPERSGWRIEIAPLEPGSPALRQVLIANQSIATSGDLWQFVLIDGVRRSHILDPQTGMGVIGPRCATVIAPTATDADALATTACIVGFEVAAQIAQQLPQTNLLCADRIAEDAVSLSESVRVQTTADFPPDAETSPTR